MDDFFGFIIFGVFIYFCRFMTKSVVFTTKNAVFCVFCILYVVFVRRLSGGESEKHINELVGDVLIGFAVFVQ